MRIGFSTAAARRSAAAASLALSACLFFAAGLRGQDIFEAAKAGALDQMKTLVEKDPGLIAARDQNGRTPLHLASRGVHIDVVKFLVEKGADVNAQGPSAATPLHYVCSRGHLEAARFLIAHGARVDAEMAGRTTPLHLAAANGHRDVAAALLDLNAPINIPDDTEDTPLLAAAATGKWDVVDLIAGRIPAGQRDEINRPDFDGNTVLHLAARSGRAEAVQRLVSKGASIDARNAVGETAYNLAVAGGFGDVAAWLAGQGADRSPQRFPRLTGPYLGQTPPGKIPALFAKGIVSTKVGLYGTIVFSPDGREAFWKEESSKMYSSKIEHGVWSAPRAFPVPAGRGGINFPAFSPDGHRLLFIASIAGPDGHATDEQLWYAEKTAAGWSEAKPFDSVVNATGLHWQFALDGKGNLYLNSKGGICRARPDKDRYLAPEPLPAPINVPIPAAERFRAGVIGPFVPAAGDYLIYTNFKGGRLLISFKKADGGWTERQDLSERLGIEGGASMGVVTPDGRYLFYQSVKKGSGAGRGLYWVEAGDVIERMRPGKVK